MCQRSIGRSIHGQAPRKRPGGSLRWRSTAVRDVAGRSVTTIEWLDPYGNHPVQKAWRAPNVSQCGYCQARSCRPQLSSRPTGTRRSTGDMHAYRLRRDQLAPRSPVARMSMPLLDLRSDGRGQGGKRPGSSSAASAAVENRRRTARRRQAPHRPRRVPTDVIS